MARHALTGQSVALPGPESHARSGQDSRRRLLDAVPGALARAGWPGLDPAQLCAAAEVPAEAFARHFTSEQACFLAAYRHHADQLIDAVRRAASQAEDGPEQVRDTFAILLGFLADRPAVAELIVVHVLSGGPQAVCERDRLAGALSRLIAARVRPGPTDRAAAGALRRSAGGAVAQLLYAWVAAGRADQLRELLPTCTYLALVVSLEPGDAATVSGLGGLEE
jgi:AcrR family transcriptional regulator